MTTFLATVVVLGILIFVHELGHFLLAKILGVRVEAFSLGFPPKLIHKQIGETDYRLSVIPLGGYVRLLGENPNDEVPPGMEPFSFNHHPLWHRFLIVLAGPVFNLFFAILALFLVFSLYGLPYSTTKVGKVTPNSPAAEAGLQPGDLILSVDGQQMERWEELPAKIQQGGERILTLQVKRGEEVLEVRLTPRKMEVDDILGRKISTVVIGVQISDRPSYEEVGPARAFQESLTYTFRICGLMASSIYKLLIREIPLKVLGGPIMIAQEAGKQAELGVSYLMFFMAVLSVNLAMLNLLPIPILDGGHLVFMAWEGIRGKPMHVKHREMAQALGLMIIVALMMLIFYQDILRVIGPRT